MKYRGFYIEKHFSDDIRDTRPDAHSEFTTGYRCRVYLADDVFHENLIDDFIVRQPKCEYSDSDWEVTSIIKYTDENYDRLMEKATRINADRAYKLLKSICKWIKETFPEEETPNILSDVNMFSDEFFLLTECAPDPLPRTHRRKPRCLR